MIATYRWLPLKQLVRVEFALRLPFDENLFKTFFPLREAQVAPDGNWLLVECAPDEWRNYLTFCWGTLSAQPSMLEMCERIHLEFQVFQQWQLALADDPFYAPHGRLQA